MIKHLSQGGCHPDPPCLLAINRIHACLRQLEPPLLVCSRTLIRKQPQRPSGLSQDALELVLQDSRDVYPSGQLFAGISRVEEHHRSDVSKDET